ncbi:MAG: hypothetical protein ACFFAE_02450 [Candidatus Hodarchaeota archaeon]
MKKLLVFLLLIIVTLALILPLNENPTESKSQVSKSSIQMKSIQTIQIQEVRIQWNTTFGGTDDDYGYSVIQTTDGGFALAGHTESYGAGGSDMWLVKTDVNGQPEWNITFGGTDNDHCRSLIQTEDGGFALAGYTYSYGAGIRDMWLVKTNATGQPEWNVTFGGIGIDYSWAVIQTADDGFALAGSTETYGAGSSDMWLVKTNIFGQPEWNNTYGSSDPDHSYALIQTADRGFALTGDTVSHGTGFSNMWLVKTDVNGQHEWNATFGGTGRDSGRVVIQSDDGGFALAGYTETHGAGGRNMWLVITDGFGQLKWNTTYGRSLNDEAWSVIPTADGGYILAGDTMAYITGDDDVWLVKTDAIGQPEWNVTFGGIGIDYGWSVIQTADGSFILAGSTTSYGAGESDMWLIKTIGNEVTITTESTSPEIVLGILSLLLLVVFGETRKKIQ